MIKSTLISIGATLAFVASAFPYGPTGHQIVGEIADEKLAGTPAGKAVTAYLDGLTLEKTSVIPDEIKGWDKKGADDPGIFHYSAHPRIDAQLRDFWRANQPTHDLNSAAPSHHWFHYTDVPVARAEKYADGKAGRSQWDVVHMIAFCTDVLQGVRPEQNDRKITKPIAIILLSHYVGDIHQPLHVGAEFFDKEGHVADPDRESSTLPDEGGNTIGLHLVGDPPSGRLPHTKKLHGFWDLDTVNALLPQVSDTMSKE
jgi:S1/P1 Nuclease